MIYYNSNTINDWNFGEDNIIKVYRNNAIVFYKFDSETQEFKVCYAVVDDITQYQETEFEDVFDKETEKWYKLNNLNNYEEYGVYGEGRNVTYYDGKLTIDDGYEYEWNGSSWANLGEVSGSSRLPVGYTEVEYVQNTGTSYLDIAFKPNTNTRILTEMQAVSSAKYPRLFGAGTWSAAAGINLVYQTDGGSNCLHINWYGRTSWSYYTSFTFDYDKHTYDLNKNSLYRDETLVGSTSYTTSYQSSDNLGVFTYIASGRPSSSSYWGQEHFKGKMYSFKVYDNGTLVRDLVPCIKDSDNTVGSYDIVNDVFYTVPTGYTTDKLIAGAETGTTEYPKYYTEKQDPLDNLTFNTLEDALDYAYNNCVYDGMKATIDGDKYVFDSEEGWVVIPEYYIVEDVTPGGASGWTISGSSTYNPNPSYYDDFDLETTSTTNSYKIAKVTIYGYDHFTYYLRTTAYSESYGYVMASNIDELSTNPTSMSYTSSLAITNTYGFRKEAGTAVNLNNYRRVTYNNLDKTVEHTFYVVFYGRTYSSYKGNATILIPKEQTNENWEQVTLSASSNVASSQKSLYIDNSSASNGGTTYFYYRWMVGLPSGTHSSSTNYSNYNYCPNVTSSTFTSVAGEQRQVNFVYNDTSNKTLSFRLTDGSNVLTPSDTVYFNMTYYNSCGVSSSSSNTTFPRSQSVKVGGRFRFANSSNRHYIYGYSPNISLNYDYYVGNYQSTFDITYTKLSDEAVTITYTTYDPNDSETPAFKTDITYPYNGGTTSSTTLTSYDVPYTYNYTVSQTSDMFSAVSQSYTAGQAARTITFTLYPDNREFTSVAALVAYQYAWEGMKAKVGDTNYEYKNGQWVEQTYTQYEYIRTANLATSYYKIDTGFYPTTANTLEVKFEMVDRSVDWANIVSWDDGTSAHKFTFQTVTSSYQAIVRIGGSNSVTYRPTIGANKVVVYTLPLSAASGTYSVDGGSPQTILYNIKYTLTLPANTSMHLFSGTIEKAAIGKMYYVKVYDGSGNLVKHYVPSDYNGTPCFYEIVNGEYILDTYTGSNHGTLTLGPAV